MSQQIGRDGQPAAWVAACPEDVTAVLDDVSGAWERMRLGREQAARDEAIELGELLTALPSSR